MPMAELTEAQQQAYWRYNIILTTILLLIWFVAAYIISGGVADHLCH
jgi:putative solute:sodium symporter small subunit